MSKFGRNIIILSAAMFMALPFAPARAEESYYLEIGADTPSENAAKNWQALQTKHKELLGQLKYYPKTVLEEGTAEMTRIQAGPVDSKPKAQKICTKLFAEQTPCFVIEGIDGAPPSKIISMNQSMNQSTNAAWYTPAPTPPAAKQPVILPWLAAAPKPAESVPPPAPVPVAETSSANGDVEVSEAVRVPLSETLVPPNPPVEVSPLSEPEKAAATAGAGWLNVATFPDESSAAAFWKGVRQAAPGKTASLRVRIARPMLSHGGPATALIIGPFAGQGSAADFCRDVIEPRGVPVRCHFDGDQPAATATTPSTHSDAYEARRREIMSRRNAAEAASQKRYWVQAISAKTEMEALQQWEDVRTNNGDLLAGTRSSVMASGGSYVVKIGPLSGQDDAAKLCDGLKKRKVDCLILPYSGG
jgi:hypothetical protein